MNFTECYTNLTEALTEGIKQFIPKVKMSDKAKKPGWMGHNILKSVKKKYKLFQRYLN